MPAMIRFLDYNPLPAASALAERLIRQRTSMGLSQKESARQVGVDQGTLARWERGEREPAGSFLSRVERIVPGGQPQPSDARREDKPTQTWPAATGAAVVTRNGSVRGPPGSATKHGYGLMTLTT